MTALPKDKLNLAVDGMLLQKHMLMFGQLGSILNNCYKKLPWQLSQEFGISRTTVQLKVVSIQAAYHPKTN